MSKVRAEMKWHPFSISTSVSRKSGFNERQHVMALLVIRREVKPRENGRTGSCGLQVLRGPYWEPRAGEYTAANHSVEIRSIT